MDNTTLLSPLACTLITQFVNKRLIERRYVTTADDGRQTVVSDQIASKQAGAGLTTWQLRGVCALARGAEPGSRNPLTLHIVTVPRVNNQLATYKTKA